MKGKYLLFYILSIVLLGSLMSYIILQGTELEGGAVSKFKEITGANYWDILKTTIKNNINYPFGKVLLQFIIIVLAARVFGFLARRVGQPSVVGEIVAGIVLGPSLLSTFFPSFMGFIFPSETMESLHLFSRLGLIIFMFVVGMELNWDLVRSRAKDAILISHSGIIFPFTLGVILSYFTFGNYAPQGVSFMSYSLFLGIAMSITAFPVLASIIREKNMLFTKTGVMVMTCAAIDDITAWCIFAGVIAIAGAGSFITAVFTLVMTISYTLLMFLVIKPLLAKMVANEDKLAKFGINSIVISLLLLLVSAFATRTIGIHSLFGAFLAGVIMPPDTGFRKYITERTEHISLVILLPCFFAYSGLRTQIGLINSADLWLLFVAVMAVAISGKFAGTALTARFTGQSWKNSLRVGALMNTRGLMELVVLNIGYDIGVITAEVFSIMVLMAVVTTFMTGPALNLIERVFPKDEEEAGLQSFGDEVVEAPKVKQG